MRARSPTLPDLRSQIDAILGGRDGRHSDSREHLGSARPHCPTRIKRPTYRAGHASRTPALWPRSLQAIRRARCPGARRQSIPATPSRPPQRPSKNPRADTEYNASEQKLTDPAIATAVRNLQKSDAVQDIPALYPDNLPHLLSFNWCFDPVYSGTSKKADAIHIAMFLKSITGAIKTVRNIEDLRAIGETMKLTYKTITMENEDTDFQFYDRLLTRTTDRILQGTEGRSVRHLHIDFLTRQINKLYTEWAKLFKFEKYLNTLLHYQRRNPKLQSNRLARPVQPQRSKDNPRAERNRTPGPPRGPR